MSLTPSLFTPTFHLSVYPVVSAFRQIQNLRTSCPLGPTLGLSAASSLVSFNHYLCLHHLFPTNSQKDSMDT